jgi:hypothetical protein
MAPLIFLNERSYPVGDLPRQIVGQSLEQLINVLMGIKRVLPRASLITSEPLATMSLGDHYSLIMWRNESSSNRERGRLLFGLAAQAPFRIAKELYGDPDPGVTVFRYEGAVAEGLGLAHLYGGLPVSFSHDPRWNLPMISLNVEQLLEEGEKSDLISINHASLPQHLEVHKAWLASIPRREVAGAHDLVSRRDEICPYVQFGPNVSADLSKLESPAFLQVFHYLCNLSDSVRDWDEVNPTPQYPPGTNDESASRKALCNFPTIGGGTATFTWHGKYTPGAGRIHFRLERNPRRAVVGYIGRKLGI